MSIFSIFRKKPAPQERLTPQEIREKFGYDYVGPFCEEYRWYDDMGFFERWFQRHGFPLVRFHESLAPARKNGEWFHIRPDGTPAYSQRYDFVYPFHEGLAGAVKNGEWFHILPDGTRLD